MSIGSSTAGLGASAGSFTDFSVYISETAPAHSSPLYPIWLPVGPQPFFLVLRLYGPTASAQQGSYSPPPVYVVNGDPRSTVKDVSSMSVDASREFISHGYPGA